MRFLPRLFVGLCVALLPVSSGRAHSAAAVSPTLRRLALQARARQGWPALRHYASLQRNSEERALAYLVLGYREYQDGEYATAVWDLSRSAKTRSSLSDFAEYFVAASADRSQRPVRVIDTLSGFTDRYPESPWRLGAEALLARAYAETGKSEEAIQLLTAEPRARQRPDLALLLAGAYRRAQRLPDAAVAFQEVYYGHPLAPEAAQARESLAQLQVLLEENFPAVTDEMRNARAETIFRSGRFGDALREYDELLQFRPTSPLADRWKLRRAGCLLRVRGGAEAVQTLREVALGDPVLDAERLAALVDAYAQEHDQAAMLGTLEELRTRYPDSSSYASGLLSVGNFFARQNDWETAAEYYKPLADEFPQDERSLGAQWRVAWTYYLRGQDEEARQAFAAHILRYPNSPRVPAVLYWLARMDERDGAPARARATYDLIANRFAHSYYALAAGARRKALVNVRAPHEADPPVVDLAEQIPPRDASPAGVCEPPEADDVLRAAEVLRALGLAALAEPYLRAAIADHPSSPYLILALSRVEAEQGKRSAAMIDAKRLVPDISEYPFSDLPKEIWDRLYPRPYWRLVQRQARANRVDPYLVMGLIRQESAFNPQATSRASARGLMQVMQGTARLQRGGRRQSVQRLYDPAYNVRVGSRFLRQLLNLFHGNVEEALAAYNAGDFRVREWLSRHPHDRQEFLETIPFRDTRAYVEAVLRDAAIYRQLATASPRFLKCQ